MFILLNRLESLGTPSLGRNNFSRNNFSSDRNNFSSDRYSATFVFIATTTIGDRPPALPDNSLMFDGASFTALVAALGCKYFVDAALTLVASLNLHELKERLHCVCTDERNIQFVLGASDSFLALLLSLRLLGTEQGC